MENKEQWNKEDWQVDEKTRLNIHIWLLVHV